MAALTAGARARSRGWPGCASHQSSAPWFCRSLQRVKAEQRILVCPVCGQARDQALNIFCRHKDRLLSWAECNNQFHHHIPYTDPDAAQDIILGPSQGLVDRQDFLLCGVFHIEHSSFPHNVSIARHEMG